MKMTISRYALKSFRHSGGKGIVFMIALSVMLLCSVLNIATSLQQTMLEDAVSIAGDAHCKYNNVSPEQVAKISSEPSVEWAETQFTLNHMWGELSEAHTSLGFIYSTRIGKTEGFKLTSGSAPNEINEVALPPHVAEILGIRAKVGEPFSLVLHHADGSESTFDFVVSGIMQEQRYFKAIDTNFAFVSEAFILKYGNFGEQSRQNEERDKRDLFVRFTKEVEIESAAKEIGETAGVQESDIAFNYRYLNADLQNPSAIVLIIVSLLVLMLVGGIVIYNAFGIIVSKKVTEFGLLTLIGASSKQIRVCVYLEALLHAVCAIPIGLLLGTGFSYVGLPFLRNIMEGVTLVYAIQPWTYILTILLALVMVLAGVLRPAHKAAKVAPVEAVRFSGVSEKYHKHKEQENVTLPILARHNLQRNKGRTTGIIVSLSISGILFISISTLAFSLVDSMETLAREQVAGDIQVLVGQKSANGIHYKEGDWLNEPAINQIINIDGIKSAKLFHVQDYRTYPEEIGQDGFLSESGSIVGMDETVFKEVMQKAVESDLTLKDFEEEINVIAVSTKENSYNEEFNYSIGQDITLYLQDRMREKTMGTVTLHIAGLVYRDDLPPYVMSSGNLPFLLMPQASYEKNELNPNCESISLTIDSSKHSQIVSELDLLCAENGNIHYKSSANIMQEYRRQLIGVISLIMIALAIVALVGILNLISSTLIGIQQRQQEFGVLSALGLSQKGLKRLLRYEGTLVALCSITASAIVGLSFGYGVYRALLHIGISYMQFSFPLIPLIVLCLVYGLLPLAITHFAIKQLSSHTTTELLTREA